MAQNTVRSRGRPQGYKFTRGGTPAEMGPYIGIVVNNIDNTRSGRLQVWIAEFGATSADGSPNLDDPTVWRTVNYCPPFYGATPFSGTTTGAGTYPGNTNSYGMWFTPPDLGVQVICFFIGGDPAQGYYLGCIPEPGLTHMIPAIGASSNYVVGNPAQTQYFANDPLLPVTEINEENAAIDENPRFFDGPKPVHSVQAAIFLQQGLNRDPVRGPIRSSSQRESPSAVYGISTPGTPIYQGGLKPNDIKQKLESNEIQPQDVEVIGRMGGHTFVMDDGDLEGTDQLIRIRTAKGHQITMSDDGDCFYITHANGQTWIELGKQGTVDVYSSNSVNLRSQGTINLHADQNINMFAGGSIKMKSKQAMALEAGNIMSLRGTQTLALYSEQSMSLRSEGPLAMKSRVGSWASASALNFKGLPINLNGAPAYPASNVPSMPGYRLAGTQFVPGSGWTVVQGIVETIVTRAPTHEPYPYHNQGVDNDTNLDENDVQLNQDGTAEDTAEDVRANADAKYVEVSAQPPQDPVQPETVVSEPTAPDNIGSVTREGVTTMMAQQSDATAANVERVVGTAYDDDGNLNPGWELNEDNDAVYTGDKLDQVGVGQYGQTPETLVQSGLLKPDTLNLIAAPGMTSSVLNSSSVWTGVLGITSLLGYLSAPKIQSDVQYSTMRDAYTGLQNYGVLNGSEDARYTATFLQPATAYGVDTTYNWVMNDVDDATATQLKNSARQGQYAVDFDTAYGDQINALPRVSGYTGTVQRTQLDTAVTEIINNDKVPDLQYVDQVETGNVAPVKTTGEEGTFRFSPNTSNSTG